MNVGKYAANKPAAFILPPGELFDVYVNDDTLARLISMPNVIVTSHQAFLTNEALKNIADTTLENIKEFFERDTCSNEICYKCENIGNCNHAHKEKCF